MNLRICDEILTPNIDVDTLFTRVRRNIQRKHSVQIPSSMNALLDSVVLHSVSDIDVSDQIVHDFIKKYSNEYDKKYGPFVADDLIFIDAAQYFGISLLDAIWKFRKVDNKIFRDRGVKIPDLTEAEEKHVALQGFMQGKKFFTYDDSYTWYYNGRQIRMGEIPPVPPSLQQMAPEHGLELVVDFVVSRECDAIHIETTLPENCKVFVRCNTYKCSREMFIRNGEILIKDASDISQVVIESGVFPLDEEAKRIIGTKCRNLTGEYIKFHPIFGNQIHWTYKL